MLLVSMSLLSMEKENELGKDSNVNSHEGNTTIAAETITNQTTIRSNFIHIKADVVKLQDGSNISAQEGDKTIIIEAKKSLKAENGSSISGGIVSIDTPSFQGEAGNNITSSGHTYINTAHLDNHGSIAGVLAVDFIRNSSHLRSIGHVDHLQHQGTLENNLSDTLVVGINNHSHNLYNANSGLSTFANRNTYYGNNIGIVAVSENNIQAAKTYTNTGIVTGKNITIAANDLNLTGKIGLLNDLNFKAKDINIDAHINIHHVNIQAKNARIEKGDIIIHGGNVHAMYNNYKHESAYKKDDSYINNPVIKNVKSSSATAKPVNFKGSHTPVITSDKKTSMPLPKIVLNPSGGYIWVEESKSKKENITHASPFKGIIETDAKKILSEEIKGHAPTTFKTTNNNAKITHERFDKTHTDKPTGQAYGFAAANNNPPPIPPQTFSIGSWITRSHSYIFLAGMSAGAVAHWLYTKYRTVDEDTIEEDDSLEADAAEDKEDHLETAQA